jgi:hypothetical protein
MIHVSSIVFSDQQTYRLRSGEYELSISPRFHQTMRSISFDGQMLGTPSGFYNLVIGEASGKYTGAGHTEGGQEKVLQFRLLCDEQQVEPVVGQVYSGKKIVLEKESRLLQTIFLSRITMTPEGIVEQKRFRTLAPQSFYYLYLYLYCFDKATTDYAALTADGRLQAGAFDGKFEGSNRWHLNSDVKWSAILDRHSGHGLLLYYPQIIKGANRKSAFWEVKNAYNKYYTMGAMPDQPAGYVSPLYTVIIRGFKAGAEDLSATAASLAETTASFPVPELTMVSAEKAAEEPVPAVKPGVLFAADYTLSDVSFAAQQAKGSPLVKLLLEDRAKIDFDLMSHSNRGLQIGEARASLQYSSAGNLPLNGSLEMTFSNAWPGDLNEMVVLAQTGPGKNLPGQGKFYLYKYKTSGIAAYFEVAASGKKLFLNFPVSGWAVNTWHHLLVTMSGGEVKLYVDGKLRKTGRLEEAILSWPETFSIGPISRNLGCVSNTTVANFTSYDKVFSDEEVAILAGRRLPDLKIEAPQVRLAAPAAEDVVLASSPWFQKQEKLFLEALDDAYVPRPWVPLTVHENSVKVWGREYDFASPAPLQGILTDSGNLLSGAVQMQLNGARLAFSAPEILQKGAGRAIIRRSARHQGIELELESVLEYDGMLWSTLRVLKGTQDINQLELIIPVHADRSEFIHYVGAPTAYESQNLVKHSMSRELSRKPGRVFESALRTNVWIGDNQAGLLYFLESDQYFYPVDRKDVITVDRREDGAAELKVAMVVAKMPENCPQQIQYQFGLMGTPVKPLPEGWRAFTFTAQYDSFRGDSRGSHLIYWPDQWRAMSLDPEPTRALNLDKNRLRLQNDLRENRRIIPYWTRLHYTTRDKEKVNPDAWILEKAWAAKPGRPGGGSHQYDRAATTSGWTDYLVWCTNEWGRVFGHIDGVYMDETQPIPNLNALSGGGYDDFNGVRRPTYEALGSRELIKRINYGIEQKIGRQAASVAHCSATHTMQNIGHYMAMLIGEHLYSGYFQNRNPEYLPPEEDKLYYYSYALPLDRLRAECYHRQWGAVMVWLPCLKNQRELMEHPVPTRDLLSRVMQADMLVWPLFCNGGEVRKTWKFRQEFGIGDAAVRFVPYWENSFFNCGAADVVAGFYQKGDQYLVLVSNFNRETRKIELQIDPTISLRSCQNAESGKEISLQDRKILLEIPRNDYCALRINY